MLTFDTSATLFKSSDVSIDTALSSQLVTSEVSEEEFETAADYTNKDIATYVLCDEAIQ